MRLRRLRAQVFDWLKSWFPKWLGIIPDAIINLVHWSIHAVTGWAGNIFSLVGASWTDYFKSHLTFFTGITHFAWRTWRHFEAILKHDFPTLWRWVRDAKTFLQRMIRLVERLALRLYHNALAFIKRVRNDIVQWVHRDIWKPLHDFSTWLKIHLIKWGYTAWYYVTHPDKLAAALFWFIVGLLEKNAWQVAPKVGTFFLTLFLHNMRRIAHVLEDIIDAAL